MRRFPPLLTQSEIDRALSRAIVRPVGDHVLPWGESLIGLALMLMVRSLM